MQQEDSGAPLASLASGARERSRSASSPSGLRPLAQDLSISDLLLRAGYTHERFGDHRRHIIRNAAGEEIARLCAFEATAFLMRLEGGAAEADAISGALANWTSDLRSAA